LDAAFLARVDGPHDVGVVQLSDRLHLAAEPLDRRVVALLARMNQLDRMDRTKVHMTAPEDGTHRPRAQLLEQLVTADTARNHRRLPGRGRRSRTDYESCRRP
jgi:hypothetical protein